MFASKIIVIILTIFSTEECRTERINISETNLRYPRSADDVTYCILPPHPSNGFYTLGTTGSSPVPGALLNQWQAIDFKCDRDYILNGHNVVYCLSGDWLPKIPQCQKSCKPLLSVSLEFTCKSRDEIVPCNKRVVPGTKVDAKCKSGYIPLASRMDTAVCKIDGTWSEIRTICAPECGTLPGKGTPYIIAGSSAEISEFPWHVGIYQKVSSGYPRQICAGSIISSNAIITAAHCFAVNDHKRLAIGLGKVHRLWNDTRDHYARYMDIKRVVIHPDYLGVETIYTRDIAIIYVSKIIEYSNIIKPICIEWTEERNVGEMEPGALGKVAGWGLTSETGSAAEELQQISIPTVSRKECRDTSPEAFRLFITLDKFCAGYLNGSAVCRGDSGGGLCFPLQQEDKQIYYLRGIVSVGPTHQGTCDSHHYTAFTDVLYYLIWLKDLNLHLQPSVFQCLSGENINTDDICDGISDCTDGSDESADLCKTSLANTPATSSVTVRNTPSILGIPPTVNTNNIGERTVGGCILPIFPEHGTYTIGGSTGEPTPGAYLEEWRILKFSCHNSYKLMGNDRIICRGGNWSESFPECLSTSTNHLTTTENNLPRDCSTVQGNNSGIFEIQPFGTTKSFSVYCEIKSDDEKWTVIQYRYNGRINFYKKFKEYQDGFGELKSEHWLGLEHIYQILKNGNYELLVELTDFDDRIRYARYGEFSISSVEDGYRLKTGQYSGNAGDSLVKQQNKFSTFDHDVDEASWNCAQEFHGAWWYNNCHDSNLNGPYEQAMISDKGIGIVWQSWLGNNYSLKKTKMMIRQNNT